MSEVNNSEDDPTEDKAEKTPAWIGKAGEVLNGKWFNFVRGVVKGINLIYTIYEASQPLFG